MLNIVLLEPEIPQNTGNISRTCAVTGSALHLVGPMGFSIEDRWLKRAGLDYWSQLTVYTYENWAAFREKHPEVRPWMASSITAARSDHASSSAIRAELRVSCMLSSGLAWRSR